MRSILVVNSKGGGGKTTVATSLASYYARRRGQGDDPRLRPAGLLPAVAEAAPC